MIGILNKASAMKSLELSLQHLQTNYIDIWQIHGVNNFEDYEKVIRPGGAEGRGNQQVCHKAARESIRGPISEQAGCLLSCQNWDLCMELHL